MKVLIPGHRYEISNVENSNTSQVIEFIFKEPDPLKYGEGGMLLVQDGTTNEELLEVLIDRYNYLQNQFPCRENAIVITKLEESLMWMHKRTADRVKRNVEGKHLK